MPIAKPEKTDRILILSKFFCAGFGGVPESILLLARNLKLHGVSTDVLARNGLHTNVGGLAFLPQGEEQLQPSADIAAYSAVVIAGAWNIRAPRLALQARRTGIPVFYAPKGQLCRADFVRLRDMKKLVYLFLVEVWVLLLASRIIFSSGKERAACIVPSLLTRGKAIIVPEPYEGNISGGLAPVDGDDGVTRIGFISQASPRKGLRELVEGFLGWCDANPGRSASLLIAGTAIKGSEGYWQAVAAMARAHPCGDRVIFLGQVSGAARDAFYERIDLLAVPSFFESFCLTLVEALWAGKPVFSGPDIGVLEFLPAQDGVYILPEVTPGAITHALSYFFENRDKMVRAGRAAEHAVVPALKGRDIAKQYLDEIGKVRKQYSRAPD